MRTTIGAIAAGCMLALGVPSVVSAELAPDGGPAFRDVEGLWTSFWANVRRGDLDAAARAVHSRIREEFRRGALRGPAGGDLTAVARQMAYCQLVSTPLPVGAEEIAYGFTCRRGEETAEGLITLRRDLDGVWRLAEF